MTVSLKTPTLSDLTIDFRNPGRETARYDHLKYSQHPSTGCEICSYSKKICVSPWKRLYLEEEIYSLKSAATPEKFAKRPSQISTPMSGFSQLITTPPSGSNTSSISPQPSTSKANQGKIALMQEEENLEQTQTDNSNLDLDLTDASESVPNEKFVEEHIAKEMQCLICFEVPLEPIITPCGHFHCKTCIQQWLETSDSCTSCRSTLSINDISEISGF